MPLQTSSAVISITSRVANHCVAGNADRELQCTRACCRMLLKVFCPAALRNPMKYACRNVFSVVCSNSRWIWYGSCSKHNYQDILVSDTKTGDVSI